MEVKHPKALRNVDLAKALSVSPEECTMEFMDNSSVCVTFEKHKVQIPQVMNLIMEHTEVKDIQIQETDLAKIVKAIYTNGVDSDLQKNTSDNGGGHDK